MTREYDITKLDIDSIYVELNCRGAWFNFDDYSDEFEMQDAIWDYFIELFDDFDTGYIVISDIVNASGLVEDGILMEVLDNYFKVKRSVSI